MYGVIGFIIGLLIHFLIIRPIQVKHWRKECVDDGLVPKDYAKSNIAKRRKDKAESKDKEW